MWNKFYLEKETLNTSNPNSEKLMIYVWRNLDLTELKESEDGFNQINPMKDQFANWKALKELNKFNANFFTDNLGAVLTWCKPPKINGCIQIVIGRVLLGNILTEYEQENNQRISPPDGIFVIEEKHSALMNTKVEGNDVKYYLNFTPIWAYPEYFVSLENN